MNKIFFFLDKLHCSKIKVDAIKDIDAVLIHHACQVNNSQTKMCLSELCDLCFYQIILWKQEETSGRKKVPVFLLLQPSIHQSGLPTQLLLFSQCHKLGPCTHTALNIIEYFSHPKAKLCFPRYPWEQGQTIYSNLGEVEH